MMFRTKLKFSVLFWLLMVLSLHAMPADPISSDSVRIAGLIDSYSELIYQDSAKANAAIRKAIALSEEKSEFGLWLRALNLRSRDRLMKNQLISAKADIDKALKLKENLNASILFIDTYTNLGLYHFYQSEYKEAITQHIKAIETADAFENKEGVARNYNNIGNVYIKLNDYEKALGYYQQAYDIATSGNMKAGTAHILGNLGIVYKNLGKTDSAIYVISQSLKIHKELNSFYQMALNYSNLAGLYWDLHNYDSAIYYFKEYREISEQVQNQNGIVSAELNLAELHLEQGNASDAFQYLSNLDSVILASENMEFKQKLHELKALFYEENENYERALENWKLASQWKDSIGGKDLKADIEALEIKYQTAQKEKVLIGQQAKLEEKESQLIMALLAAIFILISAVFSIYIYRQKRENKYKTESIKAITEAQEKERQRVARDLHDSVGSMLAKLKNQLSVHNNNSEELEMLTQVNKEIRQISHNMMPGSLKLFGLAAAIKSELELTEKNKNLRTDFKEFGLNGKLSEETEIHLYRIVQESIQNIVKHANATNVNVSITTDQRSLNLMIEDDGNGIGNPENFEGLGIRNIRTRVELIGGKLAIDSHPKVGTTLNINIPVK